MTHIYQPMLLKKVVIAIGIALSSIVGLYGSNGLNTNALLKSISDVETSGQYWRIGGAGERSQYQIKADVWRKYSRVPFWRASQREYQSEARRVASCYISEISQNLESDGIAVSSRNVALRWNGGINRVRFLRRHVSYASRVSNLYEHYEQFSVEESVLVKAREPIRIVLSLDEPEPAVSVSFSSPVEKRSIPRVTISVMDGPIVPPLIAAL